MLGLITLSQVLITLRSLMLNNTEKRQHVFISSSLLCYSQKKHCYRKHAPRKPQTLPLRPLTSPAWPFSSASSHWTRSTPRPGWPWRRPALPPPSPVFPHSADLKRKFISIASTPGFRRLFYSNYSLCLSGLLCRWRPLWNQIKYSKNESDAIRTYGSTFSRNFRKRELPNPKKVQSNVTESYRLNFNFWFIMQV